MAPRTVLAVVPFLVAGCVSSHSAPARPAGSGPDSVMIGESTVRVVNGAAPGGFPYRAWIPVGADPARPPRLAVWLHPSTAAFVPEAGALAPHLAARGFALLAVTDKDWSGWTGAEARRLLEFTVPHAATQLGVDGQRPLLVGFSAGGQMALLLWHRAPAAFRGVAVTGTAPLAFGPGARTLEMEPTDPRSGPVAPIFVLEGADEPGARLWRGVAENWRAAGVPLELLVVAGRGHEWLLDGGTGRDAFLAWVDRSVR